MAPGAPGAVPRLPEILKLTLPQMALMLCHIVISMTDVWACGRISAGAQASVGVVAQIYALLMLLTSLIGSGCMTTLSQCLGAGKRLRADRYAGLILSLSAIGGTVTAVPAFFLSEPIFSLMNIAEDMRPDLSAFYAAYCCQLPFYYVLTMINSVFRAHKKVMLPLCTLAVMLALNLFGDLAFGLGMFGCHAYGTAGVAWTTFAAAVIGFIENVMLGRHYGLLGLQSFAPWRWCRRAMPYLFKVGVPAALGQIIGQTGSLVSVAVIGFLPESTAILAGMSVGARVHGILMFPLSALNMSMVIFSGWLLGAGRRDELYAFSLKTALWTGGLLIIPSLALWLLREPVAGLFSEDPEAISQACLFLTFSCVMGPLNALAGVFTGTFSGTGATALTCRIGAVTCWLVGIPLSWLLGVALDGGSMGIFLGSSAASLVGTVWVIRIFRSRKWLDYGLKGR